MKNNHILQKAAGIFMCSLFLLPILAGCTQNEKVTKKLGETTQQVENQCGATDDYEGIICPQLDAEYTQTDAEQKKYEPIMQDILENGIDTEKELQTGL